MCHVFVLIHKREGISLSFFCLQYFEKTFKKYGEYNKIGCRVFQIKGRNATCLI